MNKTQIIYFLVSCIFLLGCKKDEIGPQFVDYSNFTKATNQVVIINEGGFNNSNASISVYNKAAKTSTDNVFKNANNAPLGDVAQSITNYGGYYYIVVDNSSKIEIVDTANFKSVATITGFTSPRYMEVVNATKAYVTDLYSNSIQVVNLIDNTIIKSIATSARTEQLLLLNNTMYVTEYTGKLLVINTITDKIDTTLNLSYGVKNIALDANNNLWVLADGSYTGNVNQTNAVLYKINPLTNAILQQLKFENLNDSPSQLTMSETSNSLYYLNNGVYTMTIADTVLPSSPIITSNNRVLYGLGIDPENGDIFVSDAGDYVQKGQVYIYSKTGTAKHNFTVGIIPNGFMFN